MKVRIGDFPLGDDERAAIQRVVDSGRITEHNEVRLFENEFAEWIGVKHCVAVSSGTAALMTGLSALRLGGYVKTTAKVFLPALTFAATSNAVKMCGMEPIFGDVDPFTMCLSAEHIPPVDIVMPVHLFGFMADMDAIQKEAGIAVVVEDSCEAHGSIRNGKRAGTFGTWAAFSFYIAHTIQAGELGALVTDDDDIAILARRIKAHGRACACRICVRDTGVCPNMKDRDPRYHHITPGYNFKPTEFSAALARVQLKKAEGNIKRRFENVMRLDRGLRSLERELVLPCINEDVAYMMYPLAFRQQGIRNAALIELEKRGVECRPVFGCIPLQQPAYAHLAQRYEDKLPVSMFYGENGFFVGCHQYMSDDEIDYMIQAITETVNVVEGSQDG